MAKTIRQAPDAWIKFLKMVDENKSGSENIVAFAAHAFQPWALTGTEEWRQTKSMIDPLKLDLGSQHATQQNRNR